MFENTVLIKLVEGFKEISYWSEDKSEVDFIVDKMAINVTATNEIPIREIDVLKNFNAKYQNFSNLLITKSATKDSQISINDFLLKD